MKKKSQAAMEFITTYAVAIFAVLVLMTSIIYLTDFDPFKSKDCQMGVKLGCVDFDIYYHNIWEGYISVVVIENRVGKTITISNADHLTDALVALILPDIYGHCGPWAGSRAAMFGSPTVTLAPGERIEFGCVYSGYPAPNRDEEKTFEGYIIYKHLGSTYNHSVEYTFTDNVEFYG